MAGGLVPSSRGRSGKRALNNEINVTPFVDVMLVLLVIFMVTSPMLVAGITVDLPETSSSPVSGQDEPLSVTVDKKGQVYIQETKIKLDDLAAKLKAITGEKKDTRIFVRGDKMVDYGKVMVVVGAINEAGYTKVALLTEVSDAGSSRNASKSQ
ncbi:MAG: TolR biopolymer transport protein [Rickettsiales bacterium]|jgi:biopolymer transport protein TolR|nr:TolR biopolymer transport protein [Rickettsiales bacterium]